MTRLTRIIPHVIWLLTSITLAWYAWSNHKVLKEYRRVRDAFHATDAEMADFGGRLPEYWEAAKRQDEFAAAIALRVFHQIESGDLDGAKKNLETTVSIYYRGHRYDGDTNFLTHIERYAATNVAISNAIYRKLE